MSIEHFNTEIDQSLEDSANDKVISKVGEMFKEWLRDKEQSILTYRDKTFQTVVEGNHGRRPPHQMDGRNG